MSNLSGLPRLGGPDPSMRPQEVTILARRRTAPIGRPRPSWLSGVAVALSVLWTLPLAGQDTPADPQVCTQGRITNIFVDNHSIFDVDELGGGRFIRGFYNLANSLHVRTRESFIRSELLFDVGDCYDPFLLEESGRILRSYVFIAKADVFAVRQPDGNQHVVVDTQDEWTTRVDLGVTFDGGVQLETLEISEENVGGVGAQAAVFLRQRRERKDIGARLAVPRLFGSRADGAIAVGRTRDGNFVEERVAYPFVGEVGRVAIRQTFSRRDELFPYVVTGGGVDYTHILLPFLDQRMELSVAGRLGKPGSLTLLGIGLSRESLEFRDYPGSLEIARENDFGNTAPAPAGLDTVLAAQTHETGTTRFNVFVGQRNLRFARVRGLDAMDGVQDVQLGTDIGLTLGRSIGALSSSSLPSADDLSARLRIFAAHDPGPAYLFFSGGLEGRQVFSGGANGDGWRDILGEADVYGYVRTGGLANHTFFARASASGGWSMDTPFQLTLGGRSGVRGLTEEDYPGSRRVLLSAEDRIFIRWPAPDAFDLGLTLFADAGQIWRGEVPYGVDSGWRASVGAGIRLGFPAGTRRVVRMDLAFPVGQGTGDGPIFRVTLLELLGIFSGFEDPDMGRSRRITVGPDFFTTDRR